VYKKGQLQVITPPCESADDDGYCDYYGEHVHAVNDSSVRSDDPLCSRTSGVFLPHSCGDWVIGGEDEIDALVQDLIEARERVRPKDVM